MDLLPPVTDRRQRRTRSAVQSAFLALIAETPFDDLTVDEIAARADVARATFYSHYRDKNVLLRATAVDLATQLTERIAAVAPRHGDDSYSGRGLVEIFRHASEHPALYRLVLDGAAGGLPRAELARVLREFVDVLFAGLREGVAARPAADQSLVATAFVSAVLGVLHAWIAGDLPGEPETLGPDLIRTQVAGLSWALSLPAGALPFRTQEDTAAAAG